jgi:hypothetical protein
VSVAQLDLFFHEHGGSNVANLRVGTLPAALDKTQDSFKTAWIFKNSQVVLQTRLRPNGDITHIGLCEQVEKFGDGVGKDVGYLAGAVSYLGENELLKTVDNDD